MNFFPNFLVMYSIVTLNVNGLHDPVKWKALWSELPQCDVICLQEMHVTPNQVYAFQLHCQSYDWIFSFGSSNSAGVGVAIKRNLGKKMLKIADIPGRLTCY